MKDYPIKAFPYEESYMNHGMDLRDYFAAQAMPAFVINKEVHETIFTIASQENKTPEQCLAIMSYVVADAMMEARK